MKLDLPDLEILLEAERTYGYANQISVATEELCELASVLSKYVRYPDHESFCTSNYKGENLRSKVVEEIGDVLIVLNHLYIMFQIPQSELYEAMSVKLARLKRWLDNSSEFNYTMKNR